MKSKIFISSVQSEFAHERKALAAYIREDAMLGDFFEVFLFEEQPARSRSAQAVYLDEVEGCDIYLGLFGAKYGSQDSQGISPTEREYDRAMSWTSYVEKSGSGTGVIVDKCVEQGLSRPDFDPTVGFFKTVIWRESTQLAPSQGTESGSSQRAQSQGPSRRGRVKGIQSWDPVAGPSRGTQSEMTIFERIIVACQTPKSVSELLEIVGRTNRTKFKRKVLGILRQDKIIEWTIPDKPNSRLQKYRLTAKGRALAKRNEAQ